MKKLILLFLAFVLMISPVYAEDAQQEITAKYQKETALLYGLGLIEGEIDLTAEMTRGEFAEVIYNMLGKQITYGAESVKFADVTSDIKCFSAVAYAVDRKLMNGHGDGLFRPQGAISYNEAVAVLVRTLGYDGQAERKGGYPAGYLMVAEGLRIPNGFKAENAQILRRDEAYKLISNALSVSVSDIKAVSTDKVYYSSKEQKTILETYLNIHYIDGKIVDNSITALKGASKIRSDAIKIDNVVMDVNKDNIVSSDMLGFEVRAYYKSENDINTLIYLEEKDNDVITVESEDVISVDLTQLTYENENNKQKTIDIATDASYIYNGTAVNSLTEAQLKSANGFIRVLDSDDNGSYDVLMVRNYQYMLFMSCNADGEVLYGAFNESIDLSNCENIEVIRNGEKISASDLKAYDILTISIGTAYTQIEATTDVVVGAVEEINEDTDTYYVIEGKEYKITSEYAASGIAMPKIGENGTFYITKNNKIVYCESTGSKKLGIAVRFNRGSGLSEKPQLKTFTDSGKFEIFDFADKLQLNGTWIKKEEIKNQTQLFYGEALQRQLIQYELDEEGKIRIIEFPDASKPDTDVLQAASDPRTYRYYNAGAKAIFPMENLTGQDNRAFYVKPSVVMFSIPDNIDDEYFYTVYNNKLPGIHDSNINNCQVYFNNAKDKRLGVADVVVSTVSSSRLGNWGVRPCVVKKITEGIDPQGNVCDVLTVQSGNKEQKYYGLNGTKVNGLEVGDIIQLSVNEEYITRYRKVYSIRLDTSCVEFYIKNQENGTVDKLKDFYGISSLEAVNSLAYYVNADIINADKTWGNRADNTMNTTYYHKTLVGEVLEKNGKYVVILGDDGKEYNLSIDPNLDAYYKADTYRIEKSDGKCTVITNENISVGDRLFVLSEAFAVMTAAVID